MANMLPVAIKAIQTAATVATVVNNQKERSESVALDQLRAQQNLQQQQLAQDNAIRQAEIDASTAENERVRRNALKRAVASQRAQFGSRGIDVRDGSSEAVLLGLFQETDEELAARERLDMLKSQALSQNLLQQTSSNTLALTQANERNKLNDLSNNLDRVDAITGIFS